MEEQKENAQTRYVFHLCPNCNHMLKFTSKVELDAAPLVRDPISGEVYSLVAESSELTAAPTRPCSTISKLESCEHELPHFGAPHPSVREKVEEDKRILSEHYQKLVVLNIKTGKEIAVITDTDAPVNTADKEIVIKLTPKYN